jgi:hypothetical protein
MELIREIMLRIETDRNPLEVEGYDREIVEGHLEILVEADLVKAQTAHSGTGSLILIGRPRLSWAGHEFLDAARNNTVWERAKKTLGDKMASVSFSVLKTLLTNLLLSEPGVNSP